MKRCKEKLFSLFISHYLTMTYIAFDFSYIFSSRKYIIPGKKRDRRSLLKFNGEYLSRESINNVNCQFTFNLCNILRITDTLIVRTCK